jgi:phytoene dehydrogenase-like protein
VHPSARIRIHREGSGQHLIFENMGIDTSYDVVVVGSGPNGLAAAIVAARCGLSTLVLEAADSAGGGMRSAELTLPGFLHDVCSAVHPMAKASLLFRQLPLEQFGLDWITPPVAAVHPLDTEDAALLLNDPEETARRLAEDGEAYLRSIGRVATDWAKLEKAMLGPRRALDHPIALAHFGAQALWPADSFARQRFSSAKARALFAGLAAHSILPFSKLGSSAIGLVLGAIAHVYGWPVPRGGSQSIADALSKYLGSLGGQIVTGFKVESQRQLPRARIFLLDTSPRAMLNIFHDAFAPSYRRALERFAYGPAVFKVDWALNQPIPWRTRECLASATVHVGGGLEEIARSEEAAWSGKVAEKPFVIVTQPSLFDDSRAPGGKHTAWGYCHVPNGCAVDMTQPIESQIERFAPGFREVILHRAIRTPSKLSEENPNLVGGDIAGGSNELFNLLRRPTWRTYATPEESIFLCSASTPPGGGVHGLCGYNAATLAIRKGFGEATLKRSGLSS